MGQEWRQWFWSRLMTSVFDNAHGVHGYYHAIHGIIIRKCKLDDNGCTNIPFAMNFIIIFVISKICILMENIADKMI